MLSSMKKKIRFQMFLSQEQKDYLEARASHFGIAIVEYLRRLVDADRERNR